MATGRWLLGKVRETDELVTKIWESGRVVNGQFPITRLGGSVIPEEVLIAMEEATNNWCGIWELEDKVGKAIAGYCGAEGSSRHFWIF